MKFNISSLCPVLPEHAHFTEDVHEYLELSNLQKCLETATINTSVGRLALYMMYFALLGLFKDKKEKPPTQLANAFLEARKRLPTQELLKMKLPKSALVDSKDPYYYRDQLVDLRKFYNEKVRENVKIPLEERKLMALALRISKADVSDSAFKSIEKMAWVVSPDIGAKVTSILHPDEDGDASSPKKKNSSLDSLHTRLISLVKDLGGKGFVVDTDVALKARTAGGTKESKYKEYLSTRRDIKKLFEIQYRKLISSNNNEPMDADKAYSRMESMGFRLNFIPSSKIGFKGKVGLHNGQFALFTDSGVMISGNIAPGATVTMNSKYKSEDDNAYVMRVKAPGALTSNRFYTVDYKRESHVEKFKKAEVVEKNINTFMSRWKRDIQTKFSLSQVNATAALVLYLTGARVGSKRHGTYSKKGVVTFGILSLRVSNIKITKSSIIISYIAKKGMPQKHTILLKDALTKLVAKRLSEYTKDKGKTDLLFMFPSPTGKSLIELTYSGFNRYLKSMGFNEGAHKLRHIRGTILTRQLLGKLNWKPTSSAKSLVRRQREAEVFMKEKILTPVANLLGHKSLNKTGGEKPAWRTSITSYVKPDIVIDWFTKQGLDVPNWVPKKASEE